MTNPSIPPSISDGVVPVIGADLLPCPFCLRAADIEIDREDFAIGRAFCTQCGACGPYINLSEDEAADRAECTRRWNTRSFTPPVPDNALREAAFQIGDRVEKTKGSSWRGRVVGTYSTALTPEGYAVESENEPGSVQIYPVKALAALKGSAS